jgi:putative glutamine amidotransferase
MHRPRIGIPLCLDDRERWRPGREYLYIDRRYADAISAAGGQPLHVPIGPDPAAVIATLDGLLIPGGDDFPSERPLPPDVRLDLVPEVQRQFDAALLEAARQSGLPVLGICYGMQLLALTAGGELEPHLPSSTRFGNALPIEHRMPQDEPHPIQDRIPEDERHLIEHRIPEDERHLIEHRIPEDERHLIEHRIPEDERHPIEVEPEGRLAEAIGPGAKRVNSLHHQAVLSTGGNHRVVARSPDGLIEAIELRDRDATRWEVGVQWHPEKQPGRESDALFDAFVAAARTRAVAGGSD